MIDAVLVVNAGSSSLKLRRLEGDDLTAAVDLDAPGGAFDEGALDDAVRSLGTVDAVGHRVVHGGTRFRTPTVLTDEVIAALAELDDLAPLHQPAARAAVAAVARVLPAAPAVACFDTAFHATMPAEASTLAVPAAWRSRWTLQRYGFHGLSHAWASRRVAAWSGGSDGLRLVACHLGSGASLAAVRDGRSVDTTMGFTPVSGVVMGTRPGDLDAGLVVWLLRAGLSIDEVADGLERRSGLVGLAGTADVGALVRARDGGDATAAAAFDVYLHSLCGHIASMVASLGGIDALSFTGGVGEHVPAVRAAVAERLAWLGIAVDDIANATADGDAEITGAGAGVRTFVVTCREDLEIARGVRAMLG